jgi:hypothetical protein
MERFQKSHDMNVRSGHGVYRFNQEATSFFRHLCRIPVIFRRMREQAVSD